MAVLKRIKKGGIARWVLKGATSGDFFVVPRGFKVLGPMTVENATQLTGTGTLSLGKTVGINDVYSIIVTTICTTSGTTLTWGGGVVNAGTVISAATGVLINAVVGADAKLAAMAAAVAAAQPTLVGVYGNQPLFNVTSNGATIILTAATPGAVTPAPTLSGSNSFAVAGGFVHTTTGSVDTTYMSPAYHFSTSANSVSLIPVTAPTAAPTSPSSMAVSSYNGNNLTATYSTTAAGAGVYNLCGTLISIPSGLTAMQTGQVMGSHSFYQFTATWAANNSNSTINGIAIAAGAAQGNLTTSLNAATIPGWIIMATTPAASLVNMYATRAGAYPAPTIVVGGTPGFNVSAITSITGTNIPGYVNDCITPITNTVTVANVAGANSVCAINGTNIPILNTMTAAQSSAVAAGCAYYQFTVATSATGTNYINNTIFTANATPATTATNIGNLVNIPGWGLMVVATALVTMVALTPGYAVKPVFSAGAVAAPTLSGEIFQQGVVLSGYTSSYTASTAVWVGPTPVFTTPVAPTTQTFISAYTFGGSTGINYIYTDINNPGAPSPSISAVTVPLNQTYAITQYPADVPYYLNFSNSAMHGNVNVTMELEKFS
jgi:hypothetical protein